MIKLFLRERYYLKIRVDKAASSETSVSVSNFHRNLNRQHTDGNKVSQLWEIVSHGLFGAFDIRFLCYMSQAIHSLIKCKIE